MTRQGRVGRQPGHSRYERIRFDKSNDRLRRSFLFDLQLSGPQPNPAHQFSCAAVVFLCTQDDHEALAKVTEDMVCNA